MTERAADKTASDERLHREELETIMPVIAASIAEKFAAASCSVYIYSPDALSTIASFRYGESRVIFPEMNNVDGLSPHDVPAEAELLRTHRPVQRITDADFKRWPMLNDESRRRTSNYSDLVIPLLWQGSVRGCLYLWRTGGASPFNDDEIATVMDFATVAAMAAVSTGQHDLERSHRHRLEALLQVASLSTSSSSVEEVLRHLAHAIRSAVGADVCNLYVFDEHLEEVVDAFSDGLNEREQWVFDSSAGYTVESVPVETVVQQTLRPWVVTDPENELAPESELVIYAREAGISQILVTPIVYQLEMVGVVYAWYRDPDRSFTDDSVETVQAIANQVGGVVARARLNDAMQQHNLETEALLRIGQVALTSDALEPVLDEVAGVLSDAIPHEYAMVALLNRHKESLSIIRHWGEFPDSVLNHQLPLSGSLTGEAVRTGEILNVRDAHVDDRNYQFEPDYLPVRSVLIAPLVTEHGTIGALYVGRQVYGKFSVRHERLMSLLSQHVAVAIERIQARDQLKTRATLQRYLASVVDRLVATRQPRSALQDIAATARGVVADGMAIALSSWEYGTVELAACDHVDTARTTGLDRLLTNVDLTPYRDAVEQLLLSEEPSALTVADFEPFSPALTAALLDLEIRELLVVPMRSHERAPGLLILLATDPGHEFDPEVIEIVEVAASRIGDALEREQMSRNREALLRVSESVNRRVELRELARDFAAELRRIVPFEEMYLGELDREAGITRPLYFSNPRDVAESWVEFAANSGMTGEAMRTGRPIIDNQAHRRASSEYVTQAEADYYRIHGESAMATPLIAEGEVIGVLFIGRVGSHRFRSSDFETFLLFAELVASAIHRYRLIEHRQAVYQASVEVLAAALDARDPTTHQHSRNVADYCRACAVLLGLEVDEVERIELAGLLHDIGKVGLPDHLLRRSDDLAAEDRALLDSHPCRGAEILAQHPDLLELVPLVRNQRTWFQDPDHTTMSDAYSIPYGSSIIAVADIFDELTSLGGSSTCQSVERALETLMEGDGTRFHPEVVRRFVCAIRSGEISVKVPAGQSARPSEIASWPGDHARTPEVGIGNGPSA